MATKKISYEWLSMINVHSLFLCHFWQIVKQLDKSEAEYQIGILSEKQYENGKECADFRPNWHSFWETIRNW